MKLTEEIKRKIDSMTYEQMLRQWRFAPAEFPMFEGESGEYFSKRMTHLRIEYPEEAIAASKRIGG